MISRLLNATRRWKQQWRRRLLAMVWRYIWTCFETWALHPDQFPATRVDVALLSWLKPAITEVVPHLRYPSGDRKSGVRHLQPMLAAARLTASWKRVSADGLLHDCLVIGDDKRKWFFHDCLASGREKGGEVTSHWITVGENSLSTPLTQNWGVEQGSILACPRFLSSRERNKV